VLNFLVAAVVPNIDPMDAEPSVSGAAPSGGAGGGSALSAAATTMLQSAVHQSQPSSPMEVDDPKHADYLKIVFPNFST